MRCHAEVLGIDSQPKRFLFWTSLMRPVSFLDFHDLNNEIGFEASDACTSLWVEHGYE